MSLSQRELDCLSAVESLAKDGWPARISDIAHLMSVRSPTAFELVDRLQGKGMLEKGPGGVRVSKLGGRSLRAIHRSHRIFETMLTRVGLPPEAACEESKRVERYPSKEAVRAICSYLGHPKTCPHDMPIDPDPGCCSG